MNAQIIQALGLASAGITVAAAGAALVVIHVLFGPSVSQEMENDLGRDHRG